MGWRIFATGLLLGLLAAVPVGGAEKKEQPPQTRGEEPSLQEQAAPRAARFSQNNASSPAGETSVVEASPGLPSAAASAEPLLPGSLGVPAPPVGEGTQPVLPLPLGEPPSSNVEISGSQPARPAAAAPAGSTAPAGGTAPAGNGGEAGPAFATGTGSAAPAGPGAPPPAAAGAPQPGAVAAPPPAVAPGDEPAGAEQPRPSFPPPATVETPAAPDGAALPTSAAGSAETPPGGGPAPLAGVSNGSELKAGLAPIAPNGPAGVPDLEHFPSGVNGDGRKGSNPPQEAALGPEPDPPGAGFGGIPDAELFPTAPVIEAQKGFWIKMFSRYTSEEGVIHDGLFTEPVFEVLDMREMSRRSQRRHVVARKKEIAEALRQLALAMDGGETPTPEGQRLLSLFPPGLTSQNIRERAAEVRFQRGLADRFRKGLIISGALVRHIRETLAKHQVPPDLAFLPHVESSFNLRAYSKFGAAGIWQFTRGTGRLFLDIRYEVDERLDPFKATAAAAKFLRRNFERLQSWPLAITAYNHGPQGLEKIVARRGTRDLGDFIKNYNGYLFKFASKNFYAEFLAAREVATHFERYFGPLELDQPSRFATVELPYFLDFSVASETLGVEEGLLARLNPSLRMPVLVGTKYIPAGFTLRVPHGVLAGKLLDALPEAKRGRRQKLTEVVRVQPGDTLYGLGRRFGVPWDAIARANNITAYHRIRPGQSLVIPRRAQAGGKWVAAAPPAPERKSPAKAPVVAAVQPTGETVSLDGEAIAFQKAEGASLFQELDVRGYNPERQVGTIEAAYGETVGHYASWAGVAGSAIREFNGRVYGSVLRPGQTVTIPLHEVSLNAFSQARFEFHQSREEDFYSTFAVSEAIKVLVRRGDTVWEIAQSNNVPMWLFYQHNPGLVGKSLRQGKTVLLPVIEEAAALAKPPKKEDGQPPP